jgi:phosphate transport system permease protein
MSEAPEDPIVALAMLSGGHYDRTGPLTPTGHLRRRQLVSRIMQGGQSASALLALAVLAIVIFSVAEHGAGVLSIGFLIHNPPSDAAQAGGGIAPYIVGTALMMGVATAIALPLGVLIALYMTEFAAPRPASVLRLVLDLLNGMPSVIIGLFIFGLLVVGGGQSGIAGSLALSIIMLPLIARATEEMLLLVPHSMREASQALGMSRWNTVRGVVLPSALGGILTATILAAARAAGETAPLVFVSSIFLKSTSLNLFGHGGLGLANIPVFIYTSSEEPNPYGFTRAWGAAFVLLAFITLASLGGRMLMARSRAKALAQ